MPPVFWKPIWPRVQDPATNSATSSPGEMISALLRNTKWRRPRKPTGEPAAARFFATRTAACTARIGKEAWAARSTRALSNDLARGRHCSFVPRLTWRYHRALHHDAIRSIPVSLRARGYVAAAAHVGGASADRGGIRTASGIRAAQRILDQSASPAGPRSAPAAQRGPRNQHKTREIRQTYFPNRSR